MSNPDTAAAHNEFPEDVEESTTPAETSFDAADYEKEITTACNEMEFDDDGKWVVPEGMSPEKQYAVNSERRRRDTQSAHAKASQEAKALSTKNVRLLERLEDTVKPNLTVEQAEELEDLKESDPEAWRAKLNEHENTAYEKHKATLAEIDEDGDEQAEVSRREQVLQQFLSDNPEIELTDYVFKNDLPQGLTGRLESGELGFEDFLEEAKTFLSKGKKVAGSDNKDEDEPNLSDSGGSSTPDANAVKKGVAAAEDYKTAIF